MIPYEIYLPRLWRTRKTALKRTPLSSLPGSPEHESRSRTRFFSVSVDGDSFTVILAGPVHPVLVLIGLLLSKRMIELERKH